MEATIDGRRIVLTGKVTVLEAARRLGVKIPTLCWHPRVSVLGACRLCMVEVKGINRMLAACTTQVSDGMSVLTDTPQLRKVRETMLELLICRHPLDCPTCVKGGECELQELTYHHAATDSRFPENPGPYAVADPSPFIERDPKKCVLCRRCVRVCREVRGVTVLGAMERGHHKRVGTYFQQTLDSDFQEPYNCEFCGSCIDICPVGALNSKMRKFSARTWEGTRTPSICPFCSVGCRLTLQVKEGELVRTLPLSGPNNQDQACFRGRFGTDYVNSISRLITPLLRKGEGQVPVERSEAVRFAADTIGSAGRTEILIAAGLTMEEAVAAREFAGSLVPGASVRVVDSHGLEESDVYSSFAVRSWEDLDEADLIFVAGHDFTVFEPVAGVRIRVARQNTGAGLVVLDARDALLGSEATSWLRPPGAGLPLLLGALVHTLAAAHRDRLREHPGEDLLSSVPGRDAAEAERILGLQEGAVSSLARLVAEKKKVVFVSHRGWHDPSSAVPELLTELDRLLAGKEEGSIIYLGRDCNSRGAAGISSPAAEQESGADLLLVVGADPLGNAPPFADALRSATQAEAMIVFDSYPTATACRADAVFPLPTFAEKDGTFVSGTGLRQRLETAMKPPPGVLPLWETFDEIAEAMGKSLSFAPSLQEMDPGKGRAGPRGAFRPGEARRALPADGERYVVLCGIPIADHRLRMVGESEALFPGSVVWLHPDDLPGLELADGDDVRVVSGEAEITRTVRADLKTPPGQSHVPFDPSDGELAAFVAKAERPDGWPVDFCRLTAIERVTPAEEG